MNYRGKTERYIDWEQVVARLQDREGRWTLALPNVLASTFRTVRLRRVRQLRLGPPWELEASYRNRYTSADGEHRGDLYLRLVRAPGYTEGNTERGSSGEHLAHTQRDSADQDG